jgi:hypothetical protein
MWCCFTGCVTPDVQWDDNVFIYTAKQYRTFLQDCLNTEDKGKISMTQHHIPEDTNPEQDHYWNLKPCTIRLLNQISICLSYIPIHSANNFIMVMIQPEIFRVGTEKHLFKSIYKLTSTQIFYPLLMWWEQLNSIMETSNLDQSDFSTKPIYIYLSYIPIYSANNFIMVMIQPEIFKSWNRKNLFKSIYKLTSTQIFYPMPMW